MNTISKITLSLGLTVSTFSQASAGQLLLINPGRVELLQHAEPGTEHDLIAQKLVDSAKQVVVKDKVYSVTFNERTPPSGEIRDYYSTGPYWWPNPDTPDGLPYIRRDGEFNPERDRVSDRQSLHDMVQDVRVLSFAFSVSGDEAYAEHAAKLLRVWFLDTETGMRPNLNHAQAIPGKTDGRGTGIIDAHPFAELFDAVLLLRNSTAWADDAHAQLVQWFQEYGEWLATSPNAMDEKAAINNHGTAYDLQMLAIHLFTGQTDAAKALVNGVTKQRLDEQIEANGEQPHELKRSRGWSYSTENLEHFFKIALMARILEIDLFHYRGKDEAGLQVALDLVFPYTCTPDDWPYRQTTEWQLNYISAINEIAEGAYGEDYALKETPCLEASRYEPMIWLLGDNR